MAEGQEMESSEVQALTGGIAGSLDQDAVLVERYKAGDSTAFDMLFRRYERSIYNFVAKMLSADDACDVTLETFYLAMRGIATFKSEKRFSTWLFAIAKNRCFDFMRRRRRVQTEEYDEVERPQADLSAVDPEDAAQKGELARAVNRCLAAMSPDDRLVLVLRDYQQLSHQEMGEILGASIPSVKSRIHRARQRFKDRFKKYGVLLDGKRDGS